ncbi:MAG: xanthine dehydrogenase family protein subunit M [Anaerolineae bacterium]|nr:xanthine dehydrogenase family protein subunit M [Anaerolineae bacterium]
MKPAAFKYIAAESLAQALALKAEYGDEAKWLAGGQSLVPAMNLRVAQPAVLIDLNPIEGMAGLTVKEKPTSEPHALVIKAMTRYRTLERSAEIATHCPLLHETMPHVAHPQIRNRGTLGGNLAHADPASELPAVMMVLNAKFKAQSVRGERWIAARDFFYTLFTTALAADELLTEIAIPLQPDTPTARTRTCFMEIARRRGDYAMMGVAASVTLDANGVCTDAQLGYLNAGDTPILATQAAQSLVGQSISAAQIQAAAAIARDEVQPPGNVHATVAFQRHLATVLTKRTLTTILDFRF